jgi:hypothetical protein
MSKYETAGYMNSATNPNEIPHPPQNLHLKHNIHNKTDQQKKNTYPTKKQNVTQPTTSPKMTGKKSAQHWTL